MENLKIRIPCEEVSKLVQEKAFEKGYKWEDEGKSVIFRLKRYLYLDLDGYLRYGSTESFFNMNTNKEISWQEWVYGEGYFFKHVEVEVVFYQAKAGNTVHWLRGEEVKNLSHYDWKEYIESDWYKTDMFGNKLEEKIMNFTKDDLVVGKHVVEYANNSKKYLYLGDKFVTLKSGFMWSKELTKDLTDKDLDLSWDVTKVYTVDIDKVTNLYNVFDHLVLVWKREEPKPVKEMTLAEVCEELGYDVKIKKE